LTLGNCGKSFAARSQTEYHCLICKILMGVAMRQTLATTKMSSRGQVVIPEPIRDRLSLKAGSQFVVIGQDDLVMLKVIAQPTLGEYAGLKRRLRRQARAARLKPKDVSEAIARVRGRR